MVDASGPWPFLWGTGHVLVAIPSLAAVALEGTEYPNRGALAGFHDYQSRGVVLVARAILAFAVAALAGAWLVRVLPALIVAGVVSAGLFVLTLQVFPYWMPHSEIAARGDDCVFCSADEYLDSRYRLSDGSTLSSYSDVVARAPYPDGSDEFDAWYAANVTVVPMGYPDGTALEVSVRETAGTLVLAIPFRACGSHDRCQQAEALLARRSHRLERGMSFALSLRQLRLRPARLTA